MNIKINKAPKPVGAYPHSKKVGNFLFLSGVGPRKGDLDEIPGVNKDEDGKVISHDIEIQCHSVFENVKIILEESGSNWENLVDITVFLTDMENDFKKYNEIYAEYFKHDQPCRTTVEVSSLPTPIAIELKCIATIN
jgi:2-aminomuconate deaminase